MNGARPHFEAHRSVTETFPIASFTCICLRSAGPSECDSGMSSHEKGPAWHSLPILCFLWVFFFFFDNSFIYLLLAGLGLHHFPWTFSRCSRQGLLSRCGVEASHMVASNCGTRALGHAGCSSCSPQAVQGTLKSLLQYHSSKVSILQLSTFFTVQLSHPYMVTGNSLRKFVS